MRYPWISTGLSSEFKMLHSGYDQLDIYIYVNDLSSLTSGNSIHASKVCPWGMTCTQKIAQNFSNGCQVFDRFII